MLACAKCVRSFPVWPKAFYGKVITNPLIICKRELCKYTGSNLGSNKISPSFLRQIPMLQPHSPHIGLGRKSNSLTHTGTCNVFKDMFHEGPWEDKF